MIALSPRPTLVVVGTGMAAAKLVEEILQRDPDRFHIRMFGAEPNGTYNRILLSSVLGGAAAPEQLWTHPRHWYEERGVYLHSGVKAESIDRRQQLVIGAGGKVTEPYDLLVLATGSRPFVPPLPGKELKNVFVFRTLEDCSTIAETAAKAKKAVILGGGLLGLEAARGLASFGLDVTVVEVAPHLMAQQLDASAAGLLQRKLEELGLQFRLGTQVETLAGDGCVRKVLLRGGETLEADLVIISCGIRPNVDEARAAGLVVDRAIAVDDQLTTSDPNIFALGECAQHRGQLYGLVEPLFQQAKVLAEVLTETNPQAVYQGSRLSATLKVLGVDLVSMGQVNAGVDCEVVSHPDPDRGIYEKFVLKERRLVGAILLGLTDPGGRFARMFQSGQQLDESALDLLRATPAADASPADLLALPDDTQICNCNTVPKGVIVQAIKAGKASVGALGQCTKAGTGCGSCQPTLQTLIDACSGKPAKPPTKNKIEVLKDQMNGLDTLPAILARAAHDDWAGMTEEEQQRAKWYGLFVRKPTPGHFMLRLRMEAGRTNARQFRVLADLTDEFGKGFCDLTTRQQVQLRWFTLAQLPEIWRRLDDVGLHSRQTGMDNVRGVIGCPVAGVTPHELLDATPVVEQFNRMILDNREFTNLPRKFNVTITGCLENCCHAETQDLSLVPAFRELDGAQVNGFNILVGGKQGSGGFTPAMPLDVFARPEEAAELCAEVTRIFRDHGSRATRNRARLAFLVQDRGIAWFRQELEKRWTRPLYKAGQDMRKKQHVDHLGIHPQRRDVATGKTPHYVGCLVPVGRITTAQMRGVADIAERYGDGDIRITVAQNLVIPNIPEDKIGVLSDEPIFKELPFAPSPIMRGLVACTGSDYCGMALIDTKTHAIELARELERRTEGRKVLPLTMHWSGCPAGCGLHQVATIGLQGCRSRVNGEIMDAAHVCVGGKSGPTSVVAHDLMYDVPIKQLADALEPLVSYLPRG